MTISRRLAIMAFGLVLVGLGACQRDDSGGGGIVAEPAFRADGVLTFLNADGSPITRIAIEIADTPDAMTTGLMGRRSLPTRGGMLFWNAGPRMQSFWMKNTPLPLDIIFVRADSTITNIVKRTTPLSEERIESTEEAQYVVEVRAGFTDRYGITDSTRVRWFRKEELDQAGTQ